VWLGETFLHRSAATNNIFAARWAVEWNVELVNSRDKRGRTPLFHAAAAGSVEVCQILLDNGAEVDAADGFGRTPLCAACRHGHYRTAELLLSADSSPNALSLDNGPSLKFTAWHFASLSGNPELVRILGKYAMGVGVTNVALERTEIDYHKVINPLHIASSFGSLECVEALCDAGFGSIAKTTFAFVPETISYAKPLVETGKPKTAEEWAKDRGFNKIAAILHGIHASLETCD
jgi:ankyrin repeat protein